MGMPPMGRPFALDCVLHHTRAALLSGETSDEVRFDPARLPCMLTKRRGGCGSPPYKYFAEIDSFSNGLAGVY